MTAIRRSIDRKKCCCFSSSWVIKSKMSREVLEWSVFSLKFCLQFCLQFCYSFATQYEKFCCVFWKVQLHILKSFVAYFEKFNYIFWKVFTHFEKFCCTFFTANTFLFLTITKWINLTSLNRNYLTSTSRYLQSQFHACFFIPEHLISPYL